GRGDHPHGRSIWDRTCYPIMACLLLAKGRTNFSVMPSSAPKASCTPRHWRPTHSTAHHWGASTCFSQRLLPGKGVSNDGGEIIVLGCPPQQGAGAIGRRDDLCWVAGRRGAISTLKSTPEIRLTISTTSRTEKPWPAARCRRLPRAFSGMQRSKA